RITLCVSSQCGCGMNCPFCDTRQQRLTRDMSTAELVEQVARPNQLSAPGGLAEAPAADMHGEGGTAPAAEADGPGDGEAGHDEEGTATSASGPDRGSNIVFMGMGDALANYKRVMNAVRRFGGPAPEGLGMSPR